MRQTPKKTVVTQTVVTKTVESETTITVRAQWDGLVLDLEGWKKLLDACIAAWEMCISTEDRLRKMEEQHVQWGPPAENRDILEQFEDLQVSCRIFLLDIHRSCHSVSIANQFL